MAYDIMHLEGVSRWLYQRSTRMQLPVNMVARADCQESVEVVLSATQIGLGGHFLNPLSYYVVISQHD